jgi:hypothetical protein
MKKIGYWQQNSDENQRFKIRKVKVGDITGREPHIIIVGQTEGGHSRYTNTRKRSVITGKTRSSSTYVGTRLKDS